MHSLICIYCNCYVYIFWLSFWFVFLLRSSKALAGYQLWYELNVQDWPNHLQSNKEINPLIRCLKIDKTSSLIIVLFLNEQQRMQLQIPFYHILATDNRKASNKYWSHNSPVYNFKVSFDCIHTHETYQFEMRIELAKRVTMLVNSRCGDFSVLLCSEVWLN